MPITLACACGKTLQVGDEYAGRRVKCPACGAVTDPSAAPAPPPDGEPGFAVVDPLPVRPEPEPSRTRRRKTKRRASRQPEQDDPDRLRAAEARQRLTPEALAWVAAGAAITAGFGYVILFHGRDVKAADPNEWTVRGVIFGVVFGLIALGKGVYGLCRGSFPEDDGW